MATVGARHIYRKAITKESADIQENQGQAQETKMSDKFGKIKTLEKFRNVKTLDKFSKIKTAVKFRKIKTLDKFSKINRPEKFMKIKTLDKFRKLYSSVKVTQ